ncbi:site-specific recombinase XerD [Candidatus Methanoperedens nitroreducens]|uniref:Site-specific recombinase XerD n=2 Tax=Candidatus Methanoperedens nitratireducens TaxID=1392998 RepID=A0A062V479_9EURY|nr:site-specific recombinase XerD [Candidatus Methanoperedens nitroreducens]MDJ1421024.1 tyrosine-type recombinase/integrase [Candidatus Methanoperedens sp.]
MKISSRKDSRKLPEDMLSEEEIEKMISACEHPRDRALVACLYESGGRISEIGNLKIKHIKFDQYGAVLMVGGKTGMCRVRIIFSSPYLATWLENHPFRMEPEAFVWVGICTVGRNVDNALLKMHGIVTEDMKDVQMSPKQCTRCGTMNAPTTKFCSKCGLALDIKAALEIEEKSSEVTMDFMQAAKSDPKIVDFMKMLLQSISTKD